MELIKQMPKKLPGTFWGIAVFFDPVGYDNKIINFRLFRKSTAKQGLKLLVVELAFENESFKLKKSDADKIIRLRTNCVMWQKERLINIGIENLPNDCDKFAWLDGDIIFKNNNWIKETCDNLEKYPIVQLYSEYVRMPEGFNNMSLDYIKKLDVAKTIDQENVINYSVAYKVAQMGPDILDKPISIYGQVGLAWSARKDIFKDFGILDSSAFPNLDLMMAHLFYRNYLNWECSIYSNKKMRQAFLDWAHKSKIKEKVDGSVYYTKGIILHLWHGKMENRNYQYVIDIINKEDFDPQKDIKIADNGTYIWSSNKVNMHNGLKEYFITRKEGKILKLENEITTKLFVFKLKEFKIKFIKKIDQYLGLFGIFLKKRSPLAYYKLKKIEIFARQKFRNYFKFS